MNEKPNPDTPSNAQHYEQGFDVGGLLAWFLQHQGEIGGAIGKIKDLLHIGKDKTPTAPATTPAPVVVQPSPATPPSNPYATIPGGLFLKLKGVKRQGEHVDIGGVKSGADPVNLNDVINFDLDPLDAHGEEIEPDPRSVPYQPNTYPLDGLLVDPALGTYLNVGDATTSTGKVWPAGFNNHRIGYTIEGGADLAGEYRNYGCGPNLKVKQEGDIYLTAHMTRGDGQAVVSNRVGPIRAKFWQA